MSSGYNLGIASSVSCAYESHSAVFVTRHVTHIEVLWLDKLEIGCVTLESCSAA